MKDVIYIAISSTESKEIRERIKGMHNIWNKRKEKHFGCVMEGKQFKQSERKLQ